ncbi:hypothetical protein POM88_047003 [Heracleum sosnowskyi]|uniref:DUF4216 domain-containing protein n=1 Tax=Heracleum sosnowskyi TaxID=360622 RepID=A0AAD8H8L2_9APIA|nr:hypothetical protein POM88_047003 [Heracleum sosnowskyi]
MLSGWTTAGHLACPHCTHDHDAYNISHGGKSTWFDNHRKFLPANHSFRKNKNWFTKGKTVSEMAPPLRTGEDVLQEIESLGLMKITELGSDEHNTKIIKTYKCGWKKRIEEASTFCSHYFEQHVQTKHRKVPRNVSSGESFLGNFSIFSHPGRAHGAGKTRYLDDREYIAANNYVLFNCPEVAPYIEIFTSRLQEQNPDINGAEIDKCLERDFAMWFKLYAQNASLVPNEIVRDLASGPLRSVRSVPIYYVNGYKFHTQKYGANKSTFNSGVCIKGSNYNETSNDYFGILEEILIIEYPRRPIKKTALFKCEWFDPTLKVGTRIHQRYNIVEVNCRKRLNVYEPFILAMQAMQVYFSNYPSLKRDKIDWLVACKVKARPLVEMPQITESRDRDAFQDDAPEHLNMIDTNDILAMQAMQVYFSNYPSLKRDKIDWLVACKVKARPLVEMPQITESRDRDAFQDDAPEHLNMIDTNDIPTRLNDFEGTSIYLDDDEECSEEETPIDSDEEDS